MNDDDRTIFLTKITQNDDTSDPEHARELFVHELKQEFYINSPKFLKQKCQISVLKVQLTNTDWLSAAVEILD